MKRTDYSGYKPFGDIFIGIENTGRIRLSAEASLVLDGCAGVAVAREDDTLILTGVQSVTNGQVAFSRKRGPGGVILIPGTRILQWLEAGSPARPGGKAEHEPVALDWRRAGYLRLPAEADWSTHTITVDLTMCAERAD